MWRSLLRGSDPRKGSRHPSCYLSHHTCPEFIHSSPFSVRVSNALLMSHDARADIFFPSQCARFPLIY